MNSCEIARNNVLFADNCARISLKNVNLAGDNEAIVKLRDRHS